MKWFESPGAQGTGPTQGGHAPHSMQHSGHTGDLLDFSRLYHMVLERLWILPLCILVGLLGAAYYLHVTPPMYQSRGVLQVEQTESRVVKIENVSQESLAAADFLRTVEETLTTQSLLRHVVGRPEIKNDTDLFQARADGTSYTPDEMVDRISRLVLANVRRGTRLIDVFAVHTTPATAQRLVDGVLQEFIARRAEQKSDVAQTAFKFLIEEAERLKERLRGSEQALQGYKTVYDLKQKLIERQEAVRELTKTYKDKHPKMIEARSAVAEYEQQLSQAATQAHAAPREVEASSPDSTTTASDDASANTDAPERDSIPQLVQKIETQYNVLLREVEADRTLYTSVVGRLKETDLTKGIGSDAFRIADSGSLPRAPISPNPQRAYTIGILGGLIAGLLIVLLLHAIDSTIKTVDEAEKLFGMPILGAIPNASFNHESPSFLVMTQNTDPHTSEAFRSLRASLLLLGPQEERQTFLMTSAVPSEGKSFISTNLAVSFAQQGLRTLLIDADLRRPVIHTLFGEANHAPGLVDCLVGNMPVQQALRPSVASENLYLLLAGTTAPNPAELLTGPALTQLIERLRGAFDRIIIDSPPVNPVSDTLLMVSAVQSVCLVVRAAYTPRNAVGRACAALSKAAVRPVGLVINRLPRNSRLGHSKYYYYYSSNTEYRYAYPASPSSSSSRKS